MIVTNITPMTCEASLSSRPMDKRKPSPTVDLISSAETAPCQPRVQPSLIPVTMLGSAAGRMTVSGIAIGDVPSVFAARMYIGGIYRMPSEVAIATAGIALITITK